uniref:Polyprotein allergen nematode domain-containing protein n=1 Tax=Panagrolaimus sp. ES5 TaxID=591445 RepID=A0AC34GA61_9BILA
MEARNLHKATHKHHHHPQHHSLKHRHRRDHDHEDDENKTNKAELEEFLVSNLTWLSHDQIEVLNDLKNDGSNMTELQKEIWIFYNILKGKPRRNAAEFYLLDCISWLVNLIGVEKMIDVSNLLKNSGIDSTMKAQDFLNQFSNETTKIYVEMYMSRCVNFFGIETEEFIHSLNENKNSLIFSAYDNYMIKEQNNTFFMSIKAESLFKGYHFEEALELYDTILSMNEEEISFLITLSQIKKRKADALMFLERYDEAIIIYEKYLETDENSEISDKLINALIQRADKSYDKATPEIFAKINEFFDQLEDDEAKHDAIHSIEHGCIRILYSVFGIHKAEELINLRDNSTQGFQTKYTEFFNNLTEEGQKRIANSYMKSCRKVLTFDSEESIPPTMINFL